MRAIDGEELKNQIKHMPRTVNPDLVQYSLVQTIIANMPTLTSPNEKPPCYLPEKDNPYPLCEGRGMKACAHCCLWEDYDPEEDGGRVNRSLTLEQMRKMDGEPVWVQTPGIPKYGRWVIVAGVDTEDGQRTLYCQGDYTCRNYGRDWLAYRRPPEGDV